MNQEQERGAMLLRDVATMCEEASRGDGAKWVALSKVLRAIAANGPSRNEVVLAISMAWTTVKSNAKHTDSSDDGLAGKVSLLNAIGVVLETITDPEIAKRLPS